MRDPLPPKPGEVARFDSHYDERKGTCHVLMAFEPLSGWREVEVTERRRKQEFASAMQHLVEEIYPQAEYVRIVCDNLSTHTAAALTTRASPHNKPAAWHGGSSSSTPRCMDLG